MKNLNKVLFGSALLASMTIFANADVCDDENSKECKEFYNYYCEEAKGNKFEKCKARVIELAKGGTLTTDSKAHLEEIIGNYSSKNQWSQIGYSKIFNKGKEKLRYQFEGGSFEITKLNEYTYVINELDWDDEADTYDYKSGKIVSKRCFAYDIKRKALTFLKECGKDEIDYSIPKKGELLNE